MRNPFSLGKAPTQNKSTRRSFFLKGIIIIIGLVVICFVIVRVLGSKKAAILVESVPDANVYINDELKGKTPYETESSPGEIRLKLEPLPSDTPMSPYETNVSLAEGVKTIVRRKFTGEGGDGSGEIISFEKTTNSDASLSVISIPDGVSVSVDSKPQGVTPLKISSLSPGDHGISITSRGYENRDFSVHIVQGYTLTAIVDLEKTNSSQTNQEPSQPIYDKTVKILDTPVGFLRVRKSPEISSEEVEQVFPGKTYPLVSTSDDKKWYEIGLTATESGWISAQYATESANINEGL